MERFEDLDRQGLGFGLEHLFGEQAFEQGEGGAGAEATGDEVEFAKRAEHLLPAALGLPLFAGERSLAGPTGGAEKLEKRRGPVGGEFRFGRDREAGERFAEAGAVVAAEFGGVQAQGFVPAELGVETGPGSVLADATEQKRREQQLANLRQGQGVTRKMEQTQGGVDERVVGQRFAEREVGEIAAERFAEDGLDEVATAG